MQDDWKRIPTGSRSTRRALDAALPFHRKDQSGRSLQSRARSSSTISASERHTRAAPANCTATTSRHVSASRILLTPKTVVRSGFGIVFIDQSGITTPFTTPQFPFIQNVQQKTQDSVNVRLRSIRTAHPSRPSPSRPTPASARASTRSNAPPAPATSQQWNLAVQRAITNNLSVEIAYVGSHIVHVGIPDSNLNQLTADTARARHAAACQRSPIPTTASSRLPARSAARPSPRRSYSSPIRASSTSPPTATTAAPPTTTPSKPRSSSDSLTASRSSSPTRIPS